MATPFEILRNQQTFKMSIMTVRRSASDVIPQDGAIPCDDAASQYGSVSGNDEEENGTDAAR